ncbi:rna polymerase ii subunit 3, partial [Moniliophthora roreri]
MSPFCLNSLMHNTVEHMYRSCIVPSAVRGLYCISPRHIILGYFVSQVFSSLH